MFFERAVSLGFTPAPPVFADGTLGLVPSGKMVCPECSRHVYTEKVIEHSRECINKYSCTIMVKIPTK